MTADTRRDGGFMMVALLIAMGIVAIWMTAAVPKWYHQAQRAKEEELIFRGEQYARAIVLFQNKNRGALPPDFDALVTGHYLRKKWKDPITGCDFAPVGNGVNSTPNNCPKFAQLQMMKQGSIAAPTSGQGQQQQGITGVRSQSTGTSIKIYMQQQLHNAWPFDANLMRGRMGGPGGANPQQPGRGAVDGRGGRGGDAAVPGRGGVAGPGRGGGPGGAPGGPPPPPPPRGGRGGGGN